MRPRVRDDRGLPSRPDRRLLGHRQLRREGRDEAAKTIARTLDQRVQAVVSTLDEEPVSLGDDPKVFAPAAADLPTLELSLKREGYADITGSRSYSRSFDVTGGRLGRSRVLYVHTLAEVFRDRRAAAENRRAYSTRAGARLFARSAVRRFAKQAGFRPGRVHAEVVRFPGADTRCIAFCFQTPSGCMEGDLLSVQRGRRAVSVFVLGREAEVNPFDLLLIRPALRNRIAG